MKRQDAQTENKREYSTGNDIYRRNKKENEKLNWKEERKGKALPKENN